jgi:hypothetical protein
MKSTREILESTGGQVGDNVVRGKRNIYLCESCGHGFVSEDIDQGTTPFTMPCLHPGCGQRAYSMLYAAPQVVLSKIRPALEFYKPTEVELVGKNDWVKDHVKHGGLLSRVIKRSN